MKRILAQLLVAASALCAFAQAPTVKLEPDSPAAQIVPQQSPQMLQMTPQGGQSPILQGGQANAEEQKKIQQQKLEAKRKALEGLFGQIRPATGKMGPSFLESNLYWLIGGIVAVAAIVLLLLRKRHIKPKTPYEVAKLRFENAPKIYGDLGPKAYAEEVSQIVRDYIDAVYQIPAPERTTEEFLAIAGQSEHFDGEAKADLEKILTLADIAKFARHAFSETEKDQILQSAEKFVEADEQKRRQTTQKQK